jgi:IS5 family transposase
MKQAALNINQCLKKNRKCEFLEQMDQVVPWAELIELGVPYYPEGLTGRHPFALGATLRTHFMQQRFTLSNPGMDEAFLDTPLYREFAQFDEFARLPDESSILRFCHRFEEHKLAEQILSTVNELLTQRGLLLKSGTAVDANLIAAPTPTTNKGKARDPEMHSSKRGNQWYFGMKAHIGVDAESGSGHTVRGTSGNAGYQGIEKRPDVTRHVAMGPGKRKALNKENEADVLIDKAEKHKASIRAKVEHPLQVVKRQFGFVSVRYRGLKKNTAQFVTLFALSNLWMVQCKLMAVQA